MVNDRSSESWDGEIEMMDQVQGGLNKCSTKFFLQMYLP